MTPASDTLKVGLLGYGYAGATFHAPLIRAVEGMELDRFASRSRDKVLECFPEATIHEDSSAVLGDPAVDLVVIATPNDTHFPLAEAALRAGKHVVVDKPFTLDLAEARALIALAEKTGRQLTVFHNRRWDSDFRSVHKAIDAGLVGDPTHLEIHFDRFRPQVRDRWREGDGPGAGVWFDLGPHLVDHALLLMGLPDRVTASLALQRKGARSADWAHVVLEFADRRAILHASMLVAGGVPRFIVHGTGGTALKHGMDVQESQLLAGMTPGAPGWGEDPDPLVLYDAEGHASRLPAEHGDQREFYRLVAEAVRGRDANPVPPIQSLAVMAVIDAAERSAAEGCSVELPLTDAERAAWVASRAYGFTP
ncbi:MAG: oxidoreductase [Novosphingobium lindaniclasticum]|uniref:oxidoreductase n=1 Tax=Novosphingobium lindaniclasticum TaxID=1329895 RepID=UPI00240A0273|nr:oxidoreductase [Novosphingobium lindaniclasticum]MDF2638983.1 oxidoreductase [Novosphingobium lindaniclasticum]